MLTKLLVVIETSPGRSERSGSFCIVYISVMALLLLNRFSVYWCSLHCTGGWSASAWAAGNLNSTVTAAGAVVVRMIEARNRRRHRCCGGNVCNGIVMFVMVIVPQFIDGMGIATNLQLLLMAASQATHVTLPPRQR